MMTTVLLRVGLALLLLTPCSSRAELLFYQGLMKMSRLGDGGQTKQSYRGWVIVEPETGSVVKLDYFSAAGFKLYTIDEYQGFQTVAVAGTWGRTNSVLSKAETSLDASNQLSVTTIFLQGPNSRLLVKSGTTLSFPRTLDWSSRGITPSTRTPLSDTWTETGVVSFDGAQTTSSNNRGETLAQAEARLIAEFQARGYREFLLR